MELKVKNKINGKLKIFIGKKDISQKLLQCNFDYECSAWYTNFNEKTKKKIQIIQNTCIRFCLKLVKTHISEEEFRLVNWLPTSKRVDQCISTITYNFVNNTSIYYLN